MIDYRNLIIPFRTISICSMSFPPTKRNQCLLLSLGTSKESDPSTYRIPPSSESTKPPFLPLRRPFWRSVSDDECDQVYSSYRNPAIERPPWTLNHDAIFILKKLGQGAFGEVMNLTHRTLPYPSLSGVSGRVRKQDYRESSSEDDERRGIR